MKSVGEWLHDADPLAGAAPRSEADVARLRSATLRAAEHQYRSRPGWPNAATVVTTLAIAFALSGWLSTWSGPPSSARAEHASPGHAPDAQVVPASLPVGPAATDIRQLQFSTPGGTRIIWVFNPDFSL